MDMTRFDLSLASPLKRPLREQPDPCPAAGERPLRELAVGRGEPIFLFPAAPADDHTTTAELLLILRDVLGEHAVPLPPELRAPASLESGPDETIRLDTDGALLLDRALPEEPVPTWAIPTRPIPARLRAAPPPLGPLRHRASDADEPSEDPAGADEATPPPPPLPGPDHDDPHAQIPAEGSISRGLAFGLPLSAMLWGGLVALVRWLTRR